jgi:SAM-dependent methyltransferase
MPLPPLKRLLDPRTSREAEECPVLDSVNIPLGQLEARIQELGSRSDIVRVVGPSEIALATIQMLERGGRQAVHELDFQWGNPGPGRLWKPSDFLEQTLPKITPGRALDMGCGSGRDVLAMATSGWHAVGADILPDALTRAQDLAQRYIPYQQDRVEWLCADLEKPLPFADESFDLITLFRFLPRTVLPEIPRLLKAGGSILLETFTPAHRQRHGKPSNDARLLGPTDALTLFPTLRVKHQSYAWRENGTHTSRLWAVKA